MRSVRLLPVAGFFFILPLLQGKVSHTQRPLKKSSKEIAADEDHYCSLANKQVVKIGEPYTLENRLRVFSALLKELIVVQDSQDSLRKQGRVSKYPKCLETYKLVLEGHLAEIKKQNPDAYENQTLLADYKYVMGHHKEAMASYSTAGAMLSGDINAGTKELASIVHVLSDDPKERDRTLYWQKRILLTLKAMKTGNRSRPTIMEEIRLMSKDLGIRLSRVFDSFGGFAYADIFSEMRFANFGVGMGLVEEGSTSAEDVSQQFVRHKGFSQLIMGRDDLMNLIREMNTQGGAALKKALGLLFPATVMSELKVVITKNNTMINEADKKESDKDKKGVSAKGGLDAVAAKDLASAEGGAIAGKDGTVLDPSRSLSGYAEGGVSYPNFSEDFAATGTNVKSGEVSPVDASSIAMSAAEKSRHEKAVEKNEFCMEPGNAANPVCQKTVSSDTDGNRDLALTQTQVPVPVLVVQGQAAKVAPAAEKTMTAAEKAKAVTKAASRALAGMAVEAKKITPQNKNIFTYSPDCHGGTAVSDLLATVRGFSGDLTHTLNQMGGLRNCAEPWQDFLGKAKKDCDVTVGISKRCGRGKEGDAEACRESIKAVSSGLANEFYGGNPDDVAQTVKKYSDTGELPTDHMRGVLCEFAGLVNVGQSIMYYGGDSGGGASGTSSFSIEH